MSAARYILALLCFASAIFLAEFSMPGSAIAEETATPIVVGLDADMSAGAAQSGEAIRRGIVLAIEEINAAGGVLGRRFELAIRDHRGNPARGIDNINELSDMPGVVAIVGGIHTPVAIAELDAIHKNRVVYLSPWAAGTPITDNGHDPNYVFRVSVRDELAGGFLVEKALERGFRKVGLLLWRTAWGRSNEQAMTDALAEHGLEPAGVEWFNTATPDVVRQFERLAAQGAEVIMLVANPVDGAVAIRDMAARDSKERLPIISHWGITGGQFHRAVAAEIAEIELTFLQTFSFVEPPIPERAEPLLRAYCARFKDCGAAANIISPAGTAHAYELMQLLKLAIERAGTTEREKVRAALESLDRYDGLMRNYNPPFTPQRHDALDRSSFTISRFTADGGIVPVGNK
jgi:branched-chain amino acid transport system substrate-binding protein